MENESKNRENESQTGIVRLLRFDRILRKIKIVYMTYYAYINWP